MTEDFQKRVLDEFRAINQRIDKMESNMATKDDIANMATKDDIANMATKDDIANIQDDIKVLTDGQRGLRKEMDTRFTDLNVKVRKILEQTVRNSELEPTVIELKKRVEDCESDIRIVKRLITK